MAHNYLQTDLHHPESIQHEYNEKPRHIVLKDPSIEIDKESEKFDDLLFQVLLEGGIVVMSEGDNFWLTFELLQQRPVRLEEQQCAERQR